MIKNKSAKNTSNEPPAAFAAPEKKWYKKWRTYFFIIIILLALAIGLSYIGYRATHQNPANVSLIGAQRVPDEQLYLNTADDPSWGEKNAKIKIVEFSDFQCPFCQESFPIIRELLFSHLDDVYFVYRDFPDFTYHPYAGKAAETANCANEQGKFWPMHDKLFINQEELSLENFEKYALQIGLNADEFNKCLSAGKYYAEIQKDYQDGVRLGVVGTPTFFINGYKVSGSIPKEILFKIAETILSTN